MYQVELCRGGLNWPNSWIMNISSTSLTQGCGHNHNIAGIFSRAVATEAVYEALAALEQKAEKWWKSWADFRKAFEMGLENIFCAGVVACVYSENSVLRFYFDDWY